MKRLVLPLILMLLSASSWGAPPQVSASISQEASRTISKGSDDRFTGNVRVVSLFTANAPSKATGGQVTFDAGARTAWHTHPVGQTLIVTSGTGRIQIWGGPIQEIKPGDVVSIPPGQKHWHGAVPGTPMTHIAIQESRDGKTAEWLEKVTDEQYGMADAKAAPAPAKNSRAQQLLGDVSPKLADLTDEVLFGDVWERPGLSKRDRSLATVSALIALNRADQLRSHLALGRQNGLTREEIAEVITHLAFYAGWPSAVTAVSVTKEVFQPK
ncbi:(R)-mandelonitrile lyase [Propionivibrio limicola]|uniref:(R)-mandelonitrile lyase n=1 Tax=Propionivibrio limicola TaxID=167645 RepID=UPI00129126EA|nr:carboxymuconolactone decarboxylase family protein [Propionivibrio limicola]